MTPSGILWGRDAIEQRYEDDFKDFQVKGVRVTTVSRAVEAHAVGNNMAWAVGEWTDVTGPETWSKRFTATRLFWPNVTAMHGSGVC